MKGVLKMIGQKFENRKNGRVATIVKFDEKAMEQKLRQRAMQYAGNFMNELYLNAKVVDNRYLFF